MAVIFALFLVLWAWGRFEIFALRTGHGNGSKIDFLFDGYFGVAGYSRVGRNFEMRFQTIKFGRGLQNFLDFCIAKPVQKSSWTEPRGIVANMEF